MKKLISCEYNIDTACVELKYADGTMISIDTIAVENEVADNMVQRSELDWADLQQAAGIRTACFWRRLADIPKRDARTQTDGLTQNISAHRSSRIGGHFLLFGYIQPNEKLIVTEIISFFSSIKTLAWISNSPASYFT